MWVLPRELARDVLIGGSCASFEHGHDVGLFQIAFEAALNPLIPSIVPKVFVANDGSSQSRAARNLSLSKSVFVPRPSLTLVLAVSLHCCYCLLQFLKM